tara:strand:+ start:329 stop:565 length:237 start_codon:yes stop_codon:yes gene_type:complete
MSKRYELSIDPIEIPTDQIHLFKDNDGNWKTNNHKAINWLCTKIENSQTSLVIDIYGEEDEDNVEPWLGYRSGEEENE